LDGKLFAPVFGLAESEQVVAPGMLELEVPPGTRPGYRVVELSVKSFPGYHRRFLPVR